MNVSIYFAKVQSEGWMVPEKSMLKTSQVIPYRQRTSGMNVGIDDNNKKHASRIQNVCYFFFLNDQSVYIHIYIYSCTHKSSDVSLRMESACKEANQTLFCFSKE